MGIFDWLSKNEIAILGTLANFTSLILWIPQAKRVYNYRKDPKALSSISLGTQYIVIANTLLWCIYGIKNKDFYLPLATILILPLSLITVIIVIKSRKRT